MISTRMKGRMGNNMFQLAAGIALAERHNTTLSYDGESHLQGLNVDAALVSRETGSITPHVYDEYKFNYNEQFASLSDGTHLDGYFQSWRYFEGHEDAVRRNFSFDACVVDRVLSSPYAVYLDICFASLHVRRQDYLGIQHAHPIPPVAYYEECLKECHADRVLVFSDDLAWCRRNFVGERFVFVDLPAAECMFMMTRATYCICANSSFSWWGSWLNTRADKVFAPRRWFGDTLPYRWKDVDLATCTKDLFPKNWRVI